MQSLTRTFFGFRSSELRDVIRQNHDLAEALKDGSSFIFKVYSAMVYFHVLTVLLGLDSEDGDIQDRATPRQYQCHVVCKPKRRGHRLQPVFQPHAYQAYCAHAYNCKSSLAFILSLTCLLIVVRSNAVLTSGCRAWRKTSGSQPSHMDLSTTIIWTHCSVLTSARHLTSSLKGFVTICMTWLGEFHSNFASASLICEVSMQV